MRMLIKTNDPQYELTNLFFFKALQENVMDKTFFHIWCPDNMDVVLAAQNYMTYTLLVKSVLQ